ncbi:Z-ring associated protein ZapG [Thaumasiovibrio sp. DFM-14]|uniref:Z-ring associated protein ZapG n=1 Tax=Thaumasiovibrio sp. DFM-14 TaxID=3384792 RepID=UPI0039A1E9FE
MTMTHAIIYFIVGTVVGALFTRMLTQKSKQQKDLQKDLDKSRYELEQYRQELTDHFAQSSALMDNIAKDYSKLYQHMAKTSAEMMPNLPSQDNPFAARITQLTPVSDEAAEKPEEVNDGIAESPKANDATAPKDYSNEATGLLSGDSSIHINSAETKAS